MRGYAGSWFAQILVIQVAPFIADIGQIQGTTIGNNFTNCPGTSSTIAWFQPIIDTLKASARR